MAKIGTAHVEVKPVLNEAALDEMGGRIEQALDRAIDAAVARRLDKLGLTEAQAETLAGAYLAIPDAVTTQEPA